MGSRAVIDFSQRVRSVLDVRYRISTQLYAVIGGAVFLTFLASLVGWLSFNFVGDAQTRVNEENVPEIVAAFGVAQYSGTLVAAAPQLTGADTPEEFARVSEEIDKAHDDFEDELDFLEKTGGRNERFERIRSHADTLLSNISAIRSDKSQHFAYEERRIALGEELANLRFNLSVTLVPAIDDQLFYTLTGYRDIDSPPAPYIEHFAAPEFDHYRYLAELQADANIATELLANAFTLSDPATVEPLRERFEAAAGRIERSSRAIEGSPALAQISPIFSQLFDLALDDGNGFDLIATQLTLNQRQRDLLARNRIIAVDLVAEVNDLVGDAQQRADQATEASTQAISTGRTLLLTIVGLSVLGAVLIAWLFVGRTLLRRLGLLSEWMQRMSRGDLEIEVAMEGRDEVADMAAALEVFRRHAVEVQRLNLVETLNRELEGKNEELENAFSELRKAQDQIVMRDKLAQMGELTAGVAHEIRNPLSLIKNFSEVSVELLTEIREAIDESGGDLTEDQQGIVLDNSEDMASNLERITNNCNRANRIVQDMLSMARESGEHALTDINGLLGEHANLAYHSARASDSAFQLDLRDDLDPNMGEIDVMPRDVGRVFLNIVKNACDAVDERRRSLETEPEAAPYMPTIWLTTRRGEENAEIRIRDNGNGIPPDIADRIFNPFFTTKPTDRGTGLGLSISNDIIRMHGGTITVESEPGQYTEFLIELPLEPGAAITDSGDEEGATTPSSP